MPIVTISECQPIEDGFSATVTINNQSRYDISVIDPFGKKEEESLEFYFEEWIKFPFDERVRAERARDSIKGYGETLFEQVFLSNPDAYSDYQEACRSGLTQLQIEIEGESPEFHALHWEALKDPKHPTPLSVECLFTRKRFHQGLVGIDLKPSSTINLLVVTARPDEENDVGYRTISRPLIEAIQQAQLRVNVELLRPGTFQALSNHLEGKEGYYHIVHFDTHGGLMTYEQFQAEVEKGHHVFQRRWGRMDLASYEGHKAFLFLEGASKGQADPVEAQELADLLTNKGVPVCILNACQSGKQVKNGTADELPESRETSLGSRLMTAGVQMVVAMGYSVTVSAAALMMEKIYTKLFSEQGIPEAIRLGRKALYNDKNRRVYFNKTVELEDWLLPVVYANQSVDLQLQELSEHAKADFLVKKEKEYKFEDEYEKAIYGFVGRDLDILKIEKALLLNNVLLLRGMGGTGKTTLLNYLREWWQTTGFVKDIFYFGYDKEKYTLQRLLREIGKKLYGESHKFSEFESMGLKIQTSWLVDYLRTEPYGLMLDNLESVTGNPLEIGNIPETVERKQIKGFLKRLRGGRTKIVLGSRAKEEWLSEVFTVEGNENQYVLGGLDPEAQSILAERILVAQVRNTKRIELLRKDSGFKKLLKLLGGYPLAMEVILANLSRQSPQKVLTDLESANVEGLDFGGDDKANNVLKCVEYSHGNLSPTLQKILMCLAPFSGFLFIPCLNDYKKQLEKFAPFEGYDFRLIDKAIQEASRWGLLTPLGFDSPELSNIKHLMEFEDNQLLAIQPILPYFLRIKLNTMDTELKDTLYEGFVRHYRDLSEQYRYLMNSKDSFTRQWGIMLCRLEYENLYNALKSDLKNSRNLSIFFCLQEYIETSLDRAQGLKLAEDVCSNRLINTSSLALSGKDGEDLTMAFDKLAHLYQNDNQYELARDIYSKALDLCESLTDVEEVWRQATRSGFFHNLGIIEQELKEYERARLYYQQALDIKVKYGERDGQACTYHQLGVLSEDLKDYTQAQLYYKQALDLCIEFEDFYSQARVYHQLGIASAALREYEQAESYYQKSLKIKIGYNARYEQSNTYHQLGVLAEEVRQYKQARAYYQKALDIKIEYNDRYAQASTYYQLGRIAQATREYSQAQLHYQQVLSIYIEFESHSKQAGVYHHLGMISQALKDYEKAQSHYQQALTIKKEHNDQYGQATTYHQLGMLAYDLRKYKEAQSYYQQALNIKSEHKDWDGQANTYHQLGMISEKMGEYKQSQSYYQQALNIKSEHNDQYGKAATYHQLGMLMQNVRKYEEAQSYFQQSIDIKDEYNDFYGLSVTYHQLGIVSKELGEYEQAWSHSQQALKICIEQDDLYGEAAAYHQLGGLLKRIEEYEKAKVHYQKSLTIKTACNDLYSQANTYYQLGTIAIEQEEYKTAREHYEQSLKIYHEHGEHCEQADVYNQLGLLSHLQGEYKQAYSSYQQALDICISCNNYDGQARTYHHLGLLSQDQEEYEQAQFLYQQALSIKIDCNNRHGQALTYGQLGLLAITVEDYNQAQNFSLQALEIFVEFKDQYGLAMTLKNLAQIHQVTQSENLLNTVSQYLDTTVSDVISSFEIFLQEPGSSNEQITK